LAGEHSEAVNRRVNRRGAACLDRHGVAWMVLTFFVPMVVVSGVLMIWQLYARRGEELGFSRERGLRTNEAPLRRAI
jgi:hypothetical protein